MTRRVAVWIVLAVAAATACASPAAAHSNDSLAPANAPPHWLPPEAWVYNHWLPYDEGRLYRLLRITRKQLWQQLRDDRHTVAELAARRGWRDPHRLAAALVAPRAPHIGRARQRILEDRALRTITQGHLAQHVFFHSLHQFAIPSAAPDIFGMPDVEFRTLRRAELSPFDIGRLHGRAPGRVLAQCAAVLRERVAAGVSGGAMTARQGRILLRRQLSQLPRWLGQARYNGPPQTHDGVLLSKPRNFASNPALSADGTHVAYEAYEQKVPVATRLGEISVAVRDLTTGATTGAGPPSGACSSPSSSYNPTISRDGARVAFECSEGNLNFAKRYGEIAVFVRDFGGLPAGRGVATQRIGVSRGDRRSISRSFFGPALSADGLKLAFAHVQPDGRTTVSVRDLATGTDTAVARGLPGDAAEASLSADGRMVAFTSIPRSGAVSLVHVHDVAGTTTLVGQASSPSLAAGGRFVAYTSQARIYVRDLAAEMTRAVAAPGGAPALDPALSGDGSIVAYTAVVGGRPRVLACDLRSGVTQIVSRASGATGAVADGIALAPSISADGTRVAFAATAGNLSVDKRDDTRGVFVRDLPSAMTTLVSAPSATR